jgi:hypothetical protein
VAERRAVPHRLEGAGAHVPHQAAALPQRVSAPRGPLGQDRRLVEQLPVLCRVSMGNITHAHHLFGVLCHEIDPVASFHLFSFSSENARQRLSECVASHLRHRDVTLEYGSGLQSSSERILLQSPPGVVGEWNLHFVDMRFSYFMVIFWGFLQCRY